MQGVEGRRKRVRKGRGGRQRGEGGGRGEEGVLNEHLTGERSEGGHGAKGSGGGGRNECKTTVVSSVGEWADG